ncbi:unnamed protein product, partial [Heterotrigona itama]
NATDRLKLLIFLSNSCLLGPFFHVSTSTSRNYEPFFSIHPVYVGILYTDYIKIQMKEGIKLIFPFQTIPVVLVLMILAVASSQDYSQLFAGFGPYLRQAAVMRDPRSNRGNMIFHSGPVLFPPGPPPNNADTSGVIVGASGYGFVPPNQ